MINKHNCHITCQSRQLELIKTYTPLTYNTCRTICMINNIIIKFKNDIKHTNKYSIEDIIYEHKDRSMGVYIIKSLSDKKKYILKLKPSKAYSQHEYDIFKLLKDHINTYIIDCVDYVKNDRYYYFIYDYFPGKTLSKYLKQHTLTEQNIKHIFLQIMLGVKYLHSLDIIHCDLKLENIMIDDCNNVKLIDFDLSKICNSNYISSNIFGTLQYIAPESYDLNIYSKKSDIWALGIILYLLITKKFPYKNTMSLNNSFSNFYRRNEFKHPELDIIKKRIEKSDMNMWLYELIEKMLCFEDYKRIDLDDILEYFTKHEFKFF